MPSMYFLGVRTFGSAGCESWLCSREPPRPDRNIAIDGGQWPAHDSPDDPFGHEGAEDHQREPPRRIEQRLLSKRIIGEMKQPVPDSRKVGYRPCGEGELVRDLAEPIRDLGQQLHAEIIGQCRRSGVLGLQGCRLRRGGLGDGLQRLNQLGALVVVLQNVQRLLRLCRGDRRWRVGRACGALRSCRKGHQQAGHCGQDQSQIQDQSWIFASHAEARDSHNCRKFQSAAAVRP